MNPYRLTPCPQRPIYTGTRSATARCGEGKVGADVTRTATVKSGISQEHADFLAHREALREAEAALVCRWRAEAVAVGSCGHAEKVEAFSDISFLDALAEAQAAAPIAAERWCFLNDHSGFAYSSTKSFTIPCEIPGMVGGHGEVRTAYSDVSQEDADALALAWATEACLAWAAVNPVCYPATYVSTKSVDVTVTCPEGQSGEPQTRTGTATAGSNVSQEDADAQATAAATVLATAEANGALHCTPILYSSEAIVTASCPSGTTGSSVSRSAIATSNVSQGDADAQALAAATAAAEGALECQPVVFSATATTTAYCAEGLDGAPSTATETATSLVSQDDAYANAVAAAQSTAESNLVCTPHLYTAHFTGTFDCPEGTTGDPVTVTGYGESTVSQAEADGNAAGDAQDQANAILVCTPI